MGVKRTTWGGFAVTLEALSLARLSCKQTKKRSLLREVSFVPGFTLAKVSILPLFPVKQISIIHKYKFNIYIKGNDGLLWLRP